jgi:rRNA maturation protein Nop10
MSQKPRIADDFDYIAARLREIEDERQYTLDERCDSCDDLGWMWLVRIRHWRECPMCSNRYDNPKPTREY